MTVGQTYALVCDLPLRIESYSAHSAHRGRRPHPAHDGHPADRWRTGGRRRGRDAVGRSACVPAAADAADRRRVDDRLVLRATGDARPVPVAAATTGCDVSALAFESAALDRPPPGRRLLADVVAEPAHVRQLDAPARPAGFDRSSASNCSRRCAKPTRRDQRLIDEIAATGAVDTADLKSQYPPPFGQPADPRLYEAVVRAFPDAWIEDPAITPETQPVLETHMRRVTWDGILWSIADIERLETRPRAINIKPVRFGSVQTLFGVYDYCAANEIAMYGGGFGELGPGRASPPVPGVPVPSRHAERCRPVGLQPAQARSVAAREPAHRGSRSHRLPLALMPAPPPARASGNGSGGA